MLLRVEFAEFDGELSGVDFGETTVSSEKESGEITRAQYTKLGICMEAKYDLLDMP